MVAKGLTGSVLIIAPIVVLVMFAGLWPASNIDGVEESVNALIANKSLANVSGFLGSLGNIAIVVAFAVVARFLAGGGNPGAGAAIRAGILFPILGAVIAAQSGLQLGTISVGSDGDVSSAKILYLISQNIGNFLPIIWGPAVALIGASLTRRDPANTFSVVIGYALLITGVAFFVFGIVDPPGVIWIIAWIAYSALTILLGVRMITLKEETSG